MKKLQRIREIIIKNDSSILDLKFGCEIKEKHSRTTDIFVGEDTNEEKLYFTLNYPDGLRADWEIIGRTITLSDVLRAMQGKEGILGVDMNGQFIDCDDDLNNVKFCGKRWNLKDNNLDNQSKECQALILKILI